MRASTRIVALAAAAGLASPALGADRYWVENIIGLWSDAGNWSLVSGGVPGGGLPQTGDDIHFNERGICIFNGAGIINPGFGDVTLSGVFSGTTSLQQGSGPWNASRMTVGLASNNCEFLMAGGSFIVGEMLVGNQAGGVGTFETSNLADFLATTVVDVGMNGGVGSVEIGGNLFEFPEMNISFGVGNPGLGHVDVLAGSVIGNTIRVGIDGDGTLFQSGGDIDVNAYSVGSVASVPPSTSIHTGGTLDVSGFLQVAPIFGDGTLTIDGADISCGTLYMGEGPGANANCTLSTGSLDATTARIGIEGDALLNQIGGTFTAGSVNLGELSGASHSGEWSFFAGTANVTGDVKVGAGATGDGRLDIDGGDLTCANLFLSATANSTGVVDLTAGSVSAGVISVGAADNANFFQSGGAIDCTTFNVGNPSDSALYRMTAPNFGTLNAQTFNNNQDVEIFGGIIEASSLNNASTGDFRLGNSPDVRISNVVNDGIFTFGTANAILSGAFTGPPLNLRFLGNFQNNALLESTAGLAADFSMNLTNSGTVDVIGTAGLDVNGSIINHNRINVDSDGGMLTAQLQCDHSSGIENRGVMFLDQGVVRTTNGDFVNLADIEGSGLIQGGLVNNGRIGRGGQLAELRIQDGYSSSSTATLEFQRYPGAHNSIRVTTGDAHIAGHLEMDFEFFTPTPGAEYVVLTVDNGIVVGTFSTVNITDAFAEVVYESNRVIVRVLGSCNAADLAAPFGSLDFSDVVAFLTAFGSMQPAADIAAPFGQWDFSDVVAFLSAFGAGCP